MQTLAERERETERDGEREMDTMGERERPWERWRKTTGVRKNDNEARLNNQLQNLS